MKSKLQSAMKDAMRAKDKMALQTIRSILSAIQYAEMQYAEKNKGSEVLPDIEIMSILQSEIKKRKESLEFEEKAARAEQIQELQAEIKTIESFLPQQLSEANLREKLQAFKANDTSANMSTAMKYLKDNFPSQYDGKLASTLAKEIFS
jgi:uncharacterized protein